MSLFVNMNVRNRLKRNSISKSVSLEEISNSKSIQPKYAVRMSTYDWKLPFQNGSSESAMQQTQPEAGHYFQQEEKEDGNKSSKPTESISIGSMMPPQNEYRKSRTSPTHALRPPSKLSSALKPNLLSFNKSKNENEVNLEDFSKDNNLLKESYVPPRERSYPNLENGTTSPGNIANLITPRAFSVSMNPNSRFGAWSRSMFFTRHTACPKRCVFIKGLLDAPVACVNDDYDCDADFMKNPFPFPPNYFNEARARLTLQDYYKSAQNGNPKMSPIPVGSSFIGKMLPNRISNDTINSLLYFTGLRNISINQLNKELIPHKPLSPLVGQVQDGGGVRINPGKESELSKGSRNSPKGIIGFRPLRENWRNALKDFTESIFGAEAKNDAKTPKTVRNGENEGIEVLLRKIKLSNCSVKYL